MKQTLDARRSSLQHTRHGDLTIHDPRSNIAPLLSPGTTRTNLGDQPAYGIRMTAVFERITSTPSKSKIFMYPHNKDVSVQMKISRCTQIQETHYTNNIRNLSNTPLSYSSQSKPSLIVPSSPLNPSFAPSPTSRCPFRACRAPAGTSKNLNEHRKTFSRKGYFSRF